MKPCPAFVIRRPWPVGPDHSRHANAEFCSRNTGREEGLSEFRALLRGKLPDQSLNRLIHVSAHILLKTPSGLEGDFGLASKAYCAVHAAHVTQRVDVFHLLQVPLETV